MSDHEHKGDKIINISNDLKLGPAEADRPNLAPEPPEGSTVIDQT